MPDTSVDTAPLNARTHAVLCLPEANVTLMPAAPQGFTRQQHVSGDVTIRLSPATVRECLLVLRERRVLLPAAIVPQAAEKQ